MQLRGMKRRLPSPSSQQPTGAASPLTTVSSRASQSDGDSDAAPPAASGGSEVSYPDTVRLRLARSKMPYRWREPIPPFESVLSSSREAPDHDLAAPDWVLKGIIDAGDLLSDESWLTSSVIDLVLARFARSYLDVHFMSSDFAAFGLKNSNPADVAACTDILGRSIDYSQKKPVIFLANINNLHWNLLRVCYNPVPELQLFEPMGKPAKRQRRTDVAVGSSSGGVSTRYIPKDVFQWLDAMSPLSFGDSWATRSCSAITQQQQTTGFDCGVASLLYAEKCGQDQMREDIDLWTTQEDMTQYRRTLQDFLSSLAESD
jgi:hypothetical protein